MWNYKVERQNSTMKKEPHKKQNHRRWRANTLIITVSVHPAGIFLIMEKISSSVPSAARSLSKHVRNAASRSSIPQRGFVRYVERGTEGNSGVKQHSAKWRGHTAKVMEWWSNVYPTKRTARNRGLLDCWSGGLFNRWIRQNDKETLSKTETKREPDCNNRCRRGVCFQEHDPIP